jgi:hypothetical protein
MKSIYKSFVAKQQHGTKKLPFVPAWAAHAIDASHEIADSAQNLHHFGTAILKMGKWEVWKMVGDKGLEPLTSPV